MQVEDIIYFSYFAIEILLLPGYEGHCVLSDALKLIVLPVSPNELKGKGAHSFLLSTLRTFTGHTDKGSGQPSIKAKGRCCASNVSVWCAHYNQAFHIGTQIIVSTITQILGPRSSFLISVN